MVNKVPGGMATSFAHLHCHTEYSIQDGLIRPGPLAERVRALGMDAVAVTDHGTMFGVLPFYLAMRQAGVHPVIGCELYVASGERGKRGKDIYGRNHYHLVVLAETLEGYRNLCSLVTRANLEGMYYKPRVDKELLGEHSKGLIGLSGCVQGEIPSALLRGDAAGARALTETYARIFGEGRFYLELQNHDLEEQRIARQGLEHLAKTVGLPLVATNDCHYLERDNADAQDVLLCVQTNKTVDCDERMRMPNDQFYVRSPDEMLACFRDAPEAVANTYEVAHRCQVELPLGKVRLPVYPANPGKSLDETLAEQARHGLIERLRVRCFAHEGEKREVWNQYLARLQHELQIIGTMGYAGYFLIVEDFIRWARNEGIPVGPGRGSAAGSLVAYALGITSLDPIRYKLLFERFLNPERVSMPDIDVDFCESQRKRVVSYVTEKYGADCVAQITTFGRMQARSAVRDAGRALGMPFQEVDRVAKAVPDLPGTTLAKAQESVPELQQWAASDPEVARLLSIATKLEGVARHASTHAAGVVIADRPLIEDVPLYRGKKDELITQYEMNSLEKIGLIKFDFLGLRTLTVIAEAVRTIQAGPDQISVDIDAISLDDPAVYAMLQRGDTDGVFQLESEGIRELIRKLCPDRFDDLIALVALYRPGPLNSGMVDAYVDRKHGREEVRYPAAALEEVLADTYGVIVYQEQVMQVAQILAGYTLGEADLLRRAMGKKKAKEMEAQKDRFLRGAGERGIAPELASSIFEQMAGFAEYGFNRSHAAAYALVAYQTAWLKTHYPREFLAALLTAEAGDADKVAEYVAACRRQGIRVLVPDLLRSNREFKVEQGGIRFGLSAIRHVGEAAVDRLVAERSANGPFADLMDLCIRVGSRRGMNKRTLQSLIDSGACDVWGGRREQYSAVVDQYLERASQRRRDRNVGQGSLFDAGGEGSESLRENLPEAVPEQSQLERLSAEKEVLGVYLSGHPLDQWQQILAWCLPRDNRLGDDATRRVGGIWADVRLHTTRRRQRMASGVLETGNGAKWNIVVFPELYAQVAALMGKDQVVVVEGRLEEGRGSNRLIAERMVPIDQALPAFASSVGVEFDVTRHSCDTIVGVADVLKAHRGPCPVHISVVDGNGTEVRIRPSSEFSVRISPQCLAALSDVLGEATRITLGHMKHP